MTERSVSIRLLLRTEGIAAGVRQAKQQLGDLTNSVQAGALKNKGSLDTVASGLGRAGIAASAAFGLAVKKFADFDQAMSNVKAATHETTGNMAALREAALQAGKDTAFSATEAAGAIENLAKAGVSTKDILGGGLSGALNLAAAGQLAVGDAAEVAATAMTQFGLSGKEVPHIADLLAAAAGKAQGEVSDVAMALKQGGLVASQFGLSIEETTGTLAAFASAGLIGSDAGTSFKTMLLALANPSAKAASTLSDLGIAAYDTKGNFVGIAPLAEQLKDKLSKLTPAQRDSALATIFGSDAIRAANVLYQNGAKGITDWTSKVNDSGYAAETASLKTDNLKGDLERLGGSLDTALIKSGEGANSTLRSLTQGADAAVTAFADLPGWVQQTALGLTGIAGLGALAAAGLIKGVQGAADLRNALQKLGQVSGALKFSMGAIGIAVAAAVTVFSAFAKESADSKQHVSELKDTLDQATGAITKNTRSYISNQLAQSGLSQKAKDMGLSLSTVTDAALGNSTALDQVVGSLDKIAEANIIANSGVQSGVVRYNEQGEAAKALKEEILSQSGALGKAQTQTKLAAEGATQTKTAQQLLAEATKKASAAVNEENKALQANYDKLVQAHNAALTLSGAQISYQAALDDATKSVKENGRTLDITTDKGRNNKTRLDELAASANRQTDAMTKAGKSNVAIAKTAEEARAAFVKVATQMTGSKKAAEALATSYFDLPAAKKTTVSNNAGPKDTPAKDAANYAAILKGTLPTIDTLYLNNAGVAQTPAQHYADVLRGTLPKVSTAVTNTAPTAKSKIDQYIAAMGLTPKSKSTSISTPGATQSQGQVGGLLNLLGALPSTKTVTINTYRNMIETHIDKGVVASGKGLPNANGGYYPTGIPSYAEGKLPGQAMVAPGRGRGLVQWAEGETGGEAFIPLGSAKRGRSVKILAQVAKQFGLTLMQSFASGGFLSGGRLVDPSYLLRQLNLPFNPLAGINYSGSLAALNKANQAAAPYRTAAIKADQTEQAAKQKVAQIQRAITLQERYIRTLRDQGASEKKIAAAQRELTKMQDGLYVAKNKLTIATKASTAADAAYKAKAEASAKAAEAYKAAVQQLVEQQKAAVQLAGQVASGLTGSADIGTLFKGSGTGLLAQLQKKGADLDKFRKLIDSLRAKKLDEDLISQIIGQGSGQGSAIAQAILAGGAGLVAALNKAQKNLDDQANLIGAGAATAQFGVKVPGARAGGGYAAAGSAYVIGEGGRKEILQMGAQSGWVTPMPIDGGRFTQGSASSSAGTVAIDYGKLAAALREGRPIDVKQTFPSQADPNAAAAAAASRLVAALGA